MEQLALNVQVRGTTDKAAVLRRSGFIPAEFYGHGIANQHLKMDYQTFRKLYRQAGTNTIINLEVEGGKNVTVLVHRVDYHPVTSNISYVEFINVRMDEEVTTQVPVRLEGLAPAVKELGGTLLQSVDEIEVRCLPKDLIHEVVANVELLVDFNSALRVSDLSVPAGITVLTDPEVVIAAVNAPREEEVEEAAPVDVASVEVTGQKAEGAESEGEAKEE